jgi:hypothetical protein
MQIRLRLDKGLPIDSNVVSVIAEAAVRDAGHGNLVDDGLFKAGKTWCNKLLLEMDLSTRRVTTDSAHLPTDWEQQGERLTLKVCIPP